MKDLYKQPMFYYIAIPLIVGIWPLWLATAGLPGAKDGFAAEKTKYRKAEKLIAQILELDPQRLDYAKANEGKGDFDYTVALDKATRQCGISSSGYRLSSGPMRRIKGGQTSQDATMTIENINIKKFATFLSTIHMRWQSLQCGSVSLSKHKGTKDDWKADLRFTYYQ